MPTNTMSMLAGGSASIPSSTREDHGWLMA
jgi:hypothetical protein